MIDKEGIKRGELGEYQRYHTVTFIMQVTKLRYNETEISQVSNKDHQVYRKSNMISAQLLDVISEKGTDKVLSDSGATLCTIENLATSLCPTHYIANSTPTPTPLNCDNRTISRVCQVPWGWWWKLLP